MTAICLPVLRAMARAIIALAHAVNVASRINELGSFKIGMGYAVCGLIEVKSSLPAIKNSTVRIVSKFV